METDPALSSWSRGADAARDLLLGSSCVGCSRPGRLWCHACAALQLPVGFGHQPTPTPVGLAPAYALGPYDGPLRSLIVGFKEDRLRALARPGASLLARAVVTLIAAEEVPAPVLLVPVPSRPASVRSRGLDSTWTLVDRAAQLLRGGLVVQGHGQFDPLDVHSGRLLRTRPGVVDQAGLDHAARARNLAGAMRCAPAAVAQVGRRLRRASVVICDDVLTTGATAREAQRALTAVGFDVVGIAVIAATQRRSSVATAVEGDNHRSIYDSGSRIFADQLTLGLGQRGSAD